MSVFKFFYNIQTSIIGAMSTTGILNRLKAKLTSQQISTKEITSLADRENEIKQKAVNQSICDAVSAAVNSEEFTKAVAEHLASELKPSLKNLDPTSYYDNLKLSNDKISEQFEDQNTKLTHLSTILETNNASTAKKISNIEESINNITKIQGDIEEKFKSLEEQQKSQLDHVAAEIVIIQEKFSTISSSLSAQIESARKVIEAAATTPSPELTKSLDTILKTLDQNSLKLDEVKTNDLSSDIMTSIQNLNNLQTTHTADLESLKQSNEKSLINTVELKSETEKISSSLITTIDQIDNIKTLLSDSKTSNSLAEILAEAKTSNESYTRCIGLLEEIKSKQTEILPIVSDSKLSLDSHTTALSEVKQTESEILDSLKSVNTTLSDQGQILIYTKNSITNDIATAAELTNASNSIEKLTKGSETLNDSLSDIKNIVTNIKPVTQNVDLSVLESSIQSVVTSIGQIETVNGSLLEKFDLTSIISNLETQSKQISDVKSSMEALASIDKKVDLTPINELINDLSSKFESQLATLNDLKTAIKSKENSHPSDSSTQDTTAE
ncbi:putative cd209 antigen [Erysiphe necator]|uniref:Putative cd209 antigen n=1 Tax=Uncinula necator TaxID=52586 RepID=A0A0B1PCP2_UNCNE|nr:putative cd209 antigen [Erysiphe necator]